MSKNLWRVLPEDTSKNVYFQFSDWQNTFSGNLNPTNLKMFPKVVRYTCLTQNLTKILEKNKQI